MRAIDANVLVCLITRDDPRQTASAESFVNKGAWVSTLVLAESTWILDTVHELNANEIGFSDCLILESARKTGNLPLGTFDRNLGKVGECERL